MDEFSLTVDYFSSENINLRRRVVPDSPTKFHLVPSITISKLQNSQKAESPPPSSLRSLRTDRETTVEPRNVDAFQYFIENNDETLLMDEIEDEDDDESPQSSQIVPTDESVKEDKELKALEDAINAEEQQQSSSAAPSPSLDSPSSSSNSTSISSDSTPNPPCTTVSTRKRAHSSFESTPILVSKRPKLIASHQKTDARPGSQSSTGTSQGGQAFRDIFNSLPLFIQVTRITVILPIKSIASLKTLEKRVAENVKVKQALHERLSRVSGANALDCIERVLNTFVTPEVRRKMDWMETPGKFCFGSTILKSSTFDSVRFHFPQVTDSQLENFTRNWFLQGNSIST